MERAVGERSCERDAAEGAQVRALATAAHLGKPPEAAPSRHPLGMRQGEAEPQRKYPLNGSQFNVTPRAGGAHMRLEEAESGLRARAAHGEGAHLLGVNEGVAAVLPTPCHAAHSTHGSTQAACRVCWGTSKFEGP